VGKESEEVSQWLQGPGHSEAKREKKYLTHEEREEGKKRAVFKATRITGTGSG
jgi:hypothetical protein